MSDIYEEYGLELETDNLLPDDYGNPDKKPNRKKRRGRTGWIRAAIALIIGSIIGITSVFGGFMLALTTPIRPTIELIGGLSGLDYEETVKNKILSEEYENMSLLDIFKELGTIVTDKNLAGIDRLSPAFGDYIDEMIGNLNTQFGLNLESDKLITTEFAELPNYLGDAFRTTPLGNMLKATAGSDTLEPLLMEICYGQEGVDYYIDAETNEIIMLDGKSPATIETFASSPNSLINSLSFAAVLPPSANDALMMSMAYGREDVTYTVEKDDDGNVIVDENNHAVVTMLPLFFLKTESGLWTDYTGTLVSCNVSQPDANGYIMMEKLGGYAGSGAQIYYLKETYGDGKFYAYKAPTSDAEPFLFQRTMIGSLTEDSSKLINNIALKDALNVHYQTEPLPHKIFFSLAYGTEGVDYVVNKADPDDHWTWTIEMLNGAQPRTIADLRDGGNSIIDDILMSDIITPDPHDALTMYMLYGKNGIHYELDAEDNIVMLQRYIAISDDSTCVYNEYGELLDPATYTLDTLQKTFTDSDGNVYKYVVSNPEKTITAEGDAGEVKVYYLTDTNNNPIMFRPHSIGELSGKNNLIAQMNKRLTLAEILGEESVSTNKFLKHLKDTTVSGLPQAITDLTIGQVFEDDIFIDCQVNDTDAPLESIEIGADGNPIMIEVGAWYYVDDNGNLHPSDTERAIRGTWKYLLLEDGVVHTDYKVATDMNKMIGNMTKNIQAATLYDLHNDGVMTFDMETLNTPIRTVFFEGTFYEFSIVDTLVSKGFDPTLYPTLGSMTTDKILTYISVLLTALPA